MTLDSKEKSVFEGEPIELLEFERGGVQAWRYTFSDSNKTVSGFVYTAVPGERSKIEASPDVNRSALVVTLPQSCQFAQQYIASPPTETVILTLRRYHLNDPDIVSWWIGRVINTEFKPPYFEVRCESSQASLKRPVLRRMYQVNCPHVLYHENTCRLDRSAWVSSVTATSVVGNVLNCAGIIATANWYRGGYVEHIKSGNFNRFFIKSQDGYNLHLNLSAEGIITVGEIVNVYPGCDRTRATCNSKFNNLDNHGGFPYTPDICPIGSGISIF
jgi:uncharacterized phage protein (TIGR02218 family)